jgi:hypothetical protein
MQDKGYWLMARRGFATERTEKCFWLDAERLRELFGMARYFNQSAVRSRKDEEGRWAISRSVARL